MGDIHTTGETAVEGTAMGADGKILLNGSVVVLLSQVCDRCAELFEREYRFDFSELFIGGFFDLFLEQFIQKDDAGLSVVDHLGNDLCRGTHGNQNGFLGDFMRANQLP